MLSLPGRNLYPNRVSQCRTASTRGSLLMSAHVLSLTNRVFGLIPVRDRSTRLGVRRGHPIPIENQIIVD